MTINKNDVIGALKTVFDPEIPVNVWDMGLIYDIQIDERSVMIKMTFTSPTCPMMEEILQQVRDAVQAIAKGMRVQVDLVWNPPWDLSRMSDEARVELDLTNQGW